MGTHFGNRNPKEKRGCGGGVLCNYKTKKKQEKFMNILNLQSMITGVPRGKWVLAFLGEGVGTM